MAQWLKKNFTEYTKAKEYAKRREELGCLTTIVGYLHGWTVCWRVK